MWLTARPAQAAALLGSSARARSKRARLEFRGARALVEAVPAAQQAVVDVHVLGPLGFAVAAAGFLDPPGQSRGDDVGDLVPPREDIVQVAVVAFGPEPPAAMTCPSRGNWRR